MKRSISYLGAVTMCAMLASDSWAASGRPESFTTSAGHAAATAAAGGCSDVFDPNENCGDPVATLGSSTYSGLMVAGFFVTSDADWYRVHLRTNEALTATMTLAVSAGDAEIGLLDGGCSSVLADERSPGAVHSISFTNTGPDADFQLVMGHYDGSACYGYDLAIAITCADAFDPNDVCASATSIGPGAYPGLSLTWFAGGDFDWYKVHVRRSEKLVLDLAYLNALGNIDGDIWTDCAMTTQLAGFFDTADGDHVEVSNDGPDADWFIRIGNENNTCNTYDMTLAIEATGNIDGVTPLAGWSRPLIPTNAPGGYPPLLSPTLDGNLANNFITWAWTQTGAKAMPTWHAHMFIDEEFSAFFINHEPAPIGQFYINPVGPYNVRGGRHTLRVINDVFGSAPETNEADNEYFEQFVWSPQPVTNASPLARQVPPLTGIGTYPNSDGFRYDRDLNHYDSVVAIAGRNAFDDYDLYLYSDYSGSTSGFSAFVGNSGFTSNLTDFVLCSYNYPIYTLFPAVIRFNAAGGGGDYTIDANEDQVRVNYSTADSLWADQVMGANRLADVYDVYAEAGETIHLTLRRTAGPSDMAFEIFPPDASALFNRGTGLATSTASTPSIDLMTFPVPSTGFYPIVVYRTDGSTSNQSLTYGFAVSRYGLLDAPADRGRAGELSFAGATPNPLRGSCAFTFMLPAAGHASLELFDASGRLASRVADGEFPAGANHVAWDGRRADGARLGPGVYWALFAAEGKKLTRRMVVLE